MGQLFQYLTKFQVLSQRVCWLQVSRGCRPLAVLIKGVTLISSASVHTSTHKLVDVLLKFNYCGENIHPSLNDLLYP